MAALIRLFAAFTVSGFLAPATAVPIDLSATGSSTTVSGVQFFSVSVPTSSGTGVIDSFVGLQAGGNATTSQGYNTSDRPLQFDENNSGNRTRDLLSSEIPRITVGGIGYGVFVLDINEPNNANSGITLSELRLFVGADQVTDTNAGDYDTATNTLGSLSAVWTLGSNSLLLNDNNSGSGRYDLLMLVPDSLLGSGPANFYLFSKFNNENGGFEEWATYGGACSARELSGVIACDPSITVPLPGSVALFGVGLLAAAAARRRP
jgi:hypothetical protein